MNNTELIARLRDAGRYKSINGSWATEAADALEAAQPKDFELERRIDGTWAQFCAGIGDSKDAPYPGMIGAFEGHYGQSFADKDWRGEASTWAAAWKAAKSHKLEAAQPAPQVPMTDDEIKAALSRLGSGGWFDFARAIEAHHGISNEQK